MDGRINDGCREARERGVVSGQTRVGRQRFVLDRVVVRERASEDVLRRRQRVVDLREFLIQRLPAIEERRHPLLARRFHNKPVAVTADDRLAAGQLELLRDAGRSSEYAEYYDAILAETVEKHRRPESRWEGVHNIMSKTNLLENVAKGSKILGRPTLATKLHALRDAPVDATGKLG